MITLQGEQTGLVEQVGSKRALVIGISEYNHLQPLISSKNDALELHNLVKSLGYGTTELIGEVEWEIMRDTIIDFFTNKMINTNDTLLFYYSGHGILDGDGDVYLATSEIDADTPYDKGFSFEELAKVVKKSLTNKI